MSPLFITIFDMKKRVVFIFLMLLGFWCAPHLAKLLFQKSLHAPLSTRLFWQEKIQAHSPEVSLYESFLYRFNDLGNPMRSYRGEPRRCLIMGGSTYFSKHVEWQESFLYKLDHKNPKTYFEPFVYESLKDGQALTILQDLSRRSEKFDCIMIGVQPTGELEASKEKAFPFWGQYSKYAKNPIFWVYKKSRDSLLHSEHLGAFLRKALFEQEGGASKKKQLLWRKENPDKLVYAPLEVTREFTERRKKRMRNLFKLAKKISPRVFFIGQPIAYAENQHPHVPHLWWDKYERKIGNAETIFLNNRAVAEEKRFFNKISAQVAESEGVQVIDLDQHLKEFLQYPRQVYYDKWHLTEYGTELAADYVAGFLEEN